MRTLRSLEAVILFTLLVAATCGFGLYLFAATVESIRRDVPFTYGEMGLMTGLAQAGYMISALAGGGLTMRFGPLAVIHVCILVCAAALGALALSSHVLAIGVCLTLLAGCASAIWIPIVELIARIVPNVHRGKALGLVSSGTSYGVVAISYMTASYIADDGWRFIWYAACCGVAVLAAVTWLRFGWLREVGRVGLNTHDGGRFTLRQRLSALPLWRSTGVLFLMFLTGLTCTPFQAYLSSYLVTEKGLPLETAASMWRLIGVTGMAGGLAIGALADRISLRPAMALSYAMLASASLLVLLPVASPASTNTAGITFGLAFYAVFGLVPAYVMQSFPANATALLLALMNVTQGIGGLIGNVAGGWGKDAWGSFDMIYSISFAAAAGAAIVCVIMPDGTEPPRA